MLGLGLGFGLGLGLGLWVGVGGPALASAGGHERGEAGGAKRRLDALEVTWPGLGLGLGLG